MLPDIIRIVLFSCLRDTCLTTLAYSPREETSARDEFLIKVHYYSHRVCQIEHGLKFYGKHRLKTLFSILCYEFSILSICSFSFAGLTTMCFRTSTNNLNRMLCVFCILFETKSAENNTS